MTGLFPDADYRFQMNLERGSVPEFFGNTSAHEQILAERRHWLESDANLHAALLEEGAPLLDEAIELLQQSSAMVGRDSAWARCLDLGKNLEPDFLLLIPQVSSATAGQFRLVGACVCFPSSWNLAEKIGQPLDFIHHVVPGLNEQIGVQISRFMSSLKPDIAWLRANWGLSRSGERNQHPDRRLPRLDAATPFDEIWLRIERQALVLLPGTHGVLFGIRIETYPLTEMKKDSADARGLVRALRTIPESVARYKNIADVRESVARALEIRVPG